MAKKTNVKYDCTQDALYSILETILESLRAKLTKMAVYKSKYTEDFVSAIELKVQQAKEMPDDDVREAKISGIKAKLEVLRDKSMSFFIDLKGYIDDGFEKVEIKSKYNEAGQKKMSKISSNPSDWESCAGLNTEMKSFISNYRTELTEGFMPDTFEAKVIDNSDKFDIRYREFKTAKQTGEATGGKIAANNTAYDDVMAVCNDAKKVFREDADILKLFTWSAVKDIISPPGSASLKVEIIEMGSNKPIANKKVNIQSRTSEVISLLTDAAGVALFKSIDAADYTVTIIMSPEPNIVFDKTVNTGVDARMEVVL